MTALTRHEEAIIYRWMARMGIGIAVITGVVALVVHLTR